MEIGSHVPAARAAEIVLDTARRSTPRNQAPVR
jgi:hypothetical protein